MQNSHTPGWTNQKVNDAPKQGSQNGSAGKAPTATLLAQLISQFLSLTQLSVRSRTVVVERPEQVFLSLKADPVSPSVQ